MTKHSLLFLATAIMAFASCSSDDPNPSSGGDNGSDIGILVTERPDWTAIASDWLDPTACQIVVVTQDELPVTITADDMLAAFINNECRTVATPRTEANGKVAFTLTILPKIEAREIGADVELRYYSSQTKRIYTAKPFAFTPGETLGNLVSDGYPLEFIRK